MSVKKRREQKRRRAAYVAAYLCRQDIQKCAAYPTCNDHQIQGEATR